MKKIRLLFFTAVFSVGIISNANAVLIDHGAYLTDTDTGLDWLDVSLTTNMSYNDVSSQLGVGGQFEGWEYGTTLQFISLINSYAGTNLDADIIDGDFVRFLGGEINGLPSLLGPTSPGFTFGILGDVAPNGDLAMGVIYDLDMRVDAIRVARGYFDPSSSAWDRGSFLVRQSIDVPEPAVLLLLMVGLAGLRFYRVNPA